MHAADVAERPNLAHLYKDGLFRVSTEREASLKQYIGSSLRLRLTISLAILWATELLLEVRDLVRRKENDNGLRLRHHRCDDVVNVGVVASRRVYRVRPLLRAEVESA